MTETPVKRLVCTLAVPTVISMLITSIYNMADTFFIGQIGDGATSATGAVGVAFSLMAVIQAVGFTLGMGSGNYVARMLGQRKNEKPLGWLPPDFSPLSSSVCYLPFWD